MSCCWLPTRVLYSAANLAACRGPHTAAWDGTHRFLSLSSVLHSTSGNHLDAQTETSTSEGTESETVCEQNSEPTSHNKSDSVSRHRKSKHIQRQPTSGGIKHLSTPPKPCLQPSPNFNFKKKFVHRTLLDDAQCLAGSNDQPFLTNQAFSPPGEMTSKRTQDVLSPTRPTSKKKKNERTTSSQDFIPLSQEQQPEKSDLDDLEDFFVIDTQPSAVVFKEPSSGGKEVKDSGNEDIKQRRNSGSSTNSPSRNEKNGFYAKVDSTPSDSDIEILSPVHIKTKGSDDSSGVCSCLGKRCRKCENRWKYMAIGGDDTLQGRSSGTSRPSASKNMQNGVWDEMDRKQSDGDVIEILSPRFTKSKAGDGSSGVCSCLGKRCRKCENRWKKMTIFDDDDDIDVVFEGPGKGKKNLEKDLVVVLEEKKKGSQPPVVRSPSPLSNSTGTFSPSSVANIPLPPTNAACSHQPSRQCYTSTSQGLKPKTREGEEEEEEVVVDKSQRKPEEGDESQRETRADIEKVNVIDPDVLEIESQPGCSSRSNRQGVEVIDIFNSSPESVEDAEEETIDVSKEDFLSLQKLRVADLHNTTIDLSDATLDMRHRLEKLRRWQMTGLGECVMTGNSIKPTDITFTVMSYNVLAQTLIRDNQYLYTSCDEEHLDWEYRWALLQYEIKNLNPDVLMLQEVQASHYHTYYLPWFKYLGYDGLFKKRTREKCDGCAIFYKCSKFSLMEHCSVEYMQPQVGILNRDNIALIAKLSLVSQPDAPPLCVATTHLLYNPKRHDVRLAQAVLFLSELDRLCYLGEEGGCTKYCPVLVTGDFNTEPHSTLIGFLRSGRLQYEGLCSHTLARHGNFTSQLDLGFLPPSLGITERCQHAALAQGRFTEMVHGGPIFRLSDKRNLEETLIRIHHSDRNQSQGYSRDYRNPRHGFAEGPRQSGWFSHAFNFKSVYRHSSRYGNPEVTTHHNKWITVDYMFYNGVKSPTQGTVIEGNLKLLARYQLLSGHEATRFGPLPSAVCPSDHFPLAAQFLLRR